MLLGVLFILKIYSRTPFIRYSHWKLTFALCALYMVLLLLRGHPFSRAKMAFQEDWPFKRNNIQCKLKLVQPGDGCSRELAAQEVVFQEE